MHIRHGTLRCRESGLSHMFASQPEKFSCIPEGTAADQQAEQTEDDSSTAITQKRLNQEGKNRAQRIDGILHNVIGMVRTAKHISLISTRI